LDFVRGFGFDVPKSRLSGQSRIEDIDLVANFGSQYYASARLIDVVNAA
jgi:hypothetical protein